MKLISLDTSTASSGWCIYDNNEYVKSGVINLKKNKDNDNRMQNMCLSILLLLENQQPDMIVIENTAVLTNAVTQRKLTMILGVVYSYCIKSNIPLHILRPSEWRALISKEKKGRKRNELKLWSVNKVKELFNISVTDDESDAILIGKAFLNKIKDEKKENENG